MFRDQKFQVAFKAKNEFLIYKKRSSSIFCSSSTEKFLFKEKNFEK